MRCIFKHLYFIAMFAKILVVQQAQAVWRQSGCLLAESFVGF